MSKNVQKHHPIFYRPYRVERRIDQILFLIFRKPYKNLIKNNMFLKFSTKSIFTKKGTEYVQIFSLQILVPGFSYPLF